MSDIAAGSKPAKKKGAGQGWNAAADGLSVSKTFTLGTPDEAAKLAKRALQLAQKSGQTVDLRVGGAAVTVGLAAKAGVVGDAERRLAKRLEGKRSDEAKASKAARVAAKAARPPKADKGLKTASKG